MNTPRFPESCWHKASYSGNSTDCVEVARATHAVGVRDTKRRDGGALAVPSAAWAGLRGTLASAR